MKIKKIIADKRPVFCCECPVNISVIKTLEKGSAERWELLKKWLLVCWRKSAR